MARARFRGTFDTLAFGSQFFQVVPNAIVTIYEPGTTTPIAQDIYLVRSGGSPVAQPLTADADGSLEFWLDVAQDVTLSADGSGSGLGVLTVDWEPVLPPADEILADGVADHWLTNLKIGASGAPNALLQVADPYDDWDEEIAEAQASIRATIGVWDIGYESQLGSGDDNPVNRGYLHAAISGGVLIPDGATYDGQSSRVKTGVQGVARSLGVGSGMGGLDAVAVAGYATAAAPNAGAFAGNFWATTIFTPGEVLYARAIEADVFTWNETDSGLGIAIVGRIDQPIATVSPTTNGALAGGTGAVGLVLSSLADYELVDVGHPSGFGRFGYGIVIEDGAAENGLALGTEKMDNTHDSDSMPILLRGRASSTVKIARLRAGSDGSLQLRGGDTNGHTQFRDADNTVVAQVNKFGIYTVGAGMAFTGIELASDPGAPLAGSNKLYPKTDGNWYRQASAGGEVRVLDDTLLDGTFYPGGAAAQSQIGLHTYASTGVLAASATISLGVPQGLLFVTEKAGSKSGLFFLNGGAGTVTAAGTIAGFTIGDSGSDIAVYWTGAEYRIKNRTAGNAFIGATLLGDIAA